ncbi:EAL domain-containing protein [Actinoplanes sp. NPDC049599]|uniref:EAL domain-containing protein n=1 Tax=Actinoplanes sp. NPDC049599 TaxID=3363903 RepID=UPI003788D395
MNLDDLVMLAALDEPTPLEHARARRAMRRIHEDHERRLSEGAEILSDVDLLDPLSDEITEAKRIGRAAELRKRGAIVWDSNTRRLDWSDEMSRIFGLAPVEARKSLTSLFALIHPTHRAAVRRRLRAAWRNQSAVDFVCRIVVRDGSTRYVEVLLEVLTDRLGRPTGIIGTGHDATATHKRLQDDRRREVRASSVQKDLTEVDPVTGLLSRKAFADEVGRALRAGTGTLLVISAPPYIRLSTDADTDRDDWFSTAAANLVRDIAGPDPCGQLARHEFGVLMPYTTLETATPKAERVISSLRETRFMAGCGRLDAFGGLVHYDYRFPTASIELLLDAETAWRRAKHEDRPLYVLRKPPSAEERGEICRAGIRNAVKYGRFALYVQPLRDLELNRTTRHEILLRVLDDVGRPVPPTAFLDLAEHVDEILAVDKWVINQALRLIGQGPQTSHYQINISGRSLADPLLLHHLRDAVERYEVDPENLTIEITETAAIGNLSVARRFADGVRQLGCQLALDDFGTGNTPLGFLTKLPVDLVKIDGSFIHGLPDSEPLQAVVEGLVQMCRKLGILTAAEYVQDDATLDLLREYGVDFAQGFHIGEPEQLATVRRPTRSIELELPLATILHQRDAV